MAPDSSLPRRFPADFIWGAATASYQIEGAANEDGRGASIWDTFSHTPGKIIDNGTGDISTDHYHRWKEDVALLKWLGVGAYRFSLAWPRILPDGAGSINEKGVAFYDHLIDALLANGITPWITLYHWDLPQALQDRFGGWQSRECAKAFSDYASVAAQRFSDRVNNWFTTNEFCNIVDAGYVNGDKAPGLRLPPPQAAVVRHHALLGHGMAAQALRQSSSRPCRVGFAEAIGVPIPLSQSAEDIAAASACMRTHQYYSAMLDGKYSPEYIAANAAGLPRGWEQDMAIIGTPVDFVGANCYSVQCYVAADASVPAGYRCFAPGESHPSFDMWWLRFDPEALYWLPRLLKLTWNVDNVIVSENGCNTPHGVDVDGAVADTERVMALRAWISCAQRAVAEGWPLKGYFHWSLLDNFEWSDGYTKRFGLVHVDYRTLVRTPKLSAKVYCDIVGNNGF
jgi:beta-glucosidase